MLSAAMGFYVLISLAPLSVIAVGLMGRALGEAEVRAYVVEASERLFDPGAAQLLSEILATPWVLQSHWLGNLSAVLMLLVASTAGFNHLRRSLNEIFESPPTDLGAVRGMLRSRAIAFLVVLIFGAAILTSLVLHTALVALSSVVDRLNPGISLPLPVFRVAEVLVFLFVLVLLFALVFRILPDRKLPWRPLFVGAWTTSVLFLLGEWLIGQYLGTASLASAFGVAQSSVLLAAWVYYSSMVFFFGAAVTCVYTEERTADGTD